MKYVVITSKHHDGFAMFGSKVSPYNIVDATPFHRDPLKELAVACQKAGLKLGFYYSQTQDWHEPDGVGNTWDFPDPGKQNFERYYDDKVLPQVRELLTNYGPIGLIWFDTPRNITQVQKPETSGPGPPTAAQLPGEWPRVPWAGRLRFGGRQPDQRG